jgi:DNA-binding NtrC family response regulator
MIKLLILDDDKGLCETLESFLGAKTELDIYTENDPHVALKRFDDEHFHIILTDVMMPNMSGLDFLKKVKEMKPGVFTDVILMTGGRDIKVAIEALRNKAYDYLLKPVNPEEMVHVLNNALEHQKLLLENIEYKKLINSKIKESNQKADLQLQVYKKEFRKIVGLGEVGVFSEKMQSIMEFCELLHDRMEVPVLIEGETGTGKEIVSRMIHFGKNHKDEPFIPINCSSISPALFESELFGYEAGAFTGAQRNGMPGKVELANNGTLFLDEIGDMPQDFQPKLLRFLQDKEFYRVGGKKPIKVNVRIVCATNRDLRTMIEEREFREDLYYRLNVSRISLPPLRERKKEIIPLIKLFLSKGRSNPGALQNISPEAEKFLLDYPWNGNIRELKNTVEYLQLRIKDPTLKLKHLTFLQFDLRNYKQNVQETKYTTELPDVGIDLNNHVLDLVEAALEKNRWNKTETAAFLGITRKVLYTYLKRLESRKL